MASVVEELELEQMSIRHKEPAEYASFEDYRQPRDERMRWRPPNPTRAFAAANLTPPPFRHDTLSRFNAAIRLLQVLPGKNDHALECRLRTFELDSVPPFVALSYRWGTKPTPHNLIHIDGLPYKVWDNLHSFLCYFRNDAFNKPGTYIWIDQICIDMKDPTEKNYAGSIMSAIYTKAAWVLSWLEVGKIGVETAHRIQKGSSKPDDLAKILGNQYFKRLWIVQEVLLAQNLVFICGDVWLHPQQLIKGLRPDATFMGVGAAYNLLDDHVRGRSRDKFRTLLLRYADQQRPGELRDRVYALQGLLDMHEQVEIDYRKSVTEVFMDAVEVLLKVPLVETDPAFIDACLRAPILLGDLMELEESIMDEFRRTIGGLKKLPPDSTWYRSVLWRLKEAKKTGWRSQYVLTEYDHDLGRTSRPL